MGFNTLLYAVFHIAVTNGIRFETNRKFNSKSGATWEILSLEFELFRMCFSQYDTMIDILNLSLASLSHYFLKLKSN